MKLKKKKTNFKHGGLENFDQPNETNIKNRVTTMNDTVCMLHKN